MGCRIRRRDFTGNLLARAEAWIEQTPAPKRVQSPRVFGKMFRLATRRAIPVETEPGQILEDRCLVFRLATGGVDVLDPQQEAPPSLPRAPPSKQGGASVPGVQQPGGTRGKTRDNRRGAHKTLFTANASRYIVETSL